MIQNLIIQLHISTLGKCIFHKISFSFFFLQNSLGSLWFYRKTHDRPEKAHFPNVNNVFPIFHHVLFTHFTYDLIWYVNYSNFYGNFSKFSHLFSSGTLQFWFSAKLFICISTFLFVLCCYLAINNFFCFYEMGWLIFTVLKLLFIDRFHSNSSRIGQKVYFKMYSVISFEKNAWMIKCQ